MIPGAKLAAARRAARLTQEALAERLQVSPQAVSAWERGESLPDTRKLISLGKILRLTPNELFAEDDTDWMLKLTEAQPLPDLALEFAVVKLSGTVRPGTRVPAVVRAAEMLGAAAGTTEDAEVLAAAVLREVLAAGRTTREELERRFGPRAAALAAEPAETTENPRGD